MAIAQTRPAARNGAGRGSSPAPAVGQRERRFSPSKLAALVAVLAEAGIAPAAVLEGTGLDEAMVANPFALTSAHQFIAAARNALRLDPRPALGLRVGTRLRASSYGMYGYALLCAESMRQAFDIAVRFHPLANPMMPIRWEAADGIASWLFPSRGELPEFADDEPMYRFLLELQFAIVVTLIKDAMGSWCIPARAHFVGEPPTHAAVLASVLECPVAFAQSANSLGYPAAWLARAPQLANPLTAAQVSEHCAKLLEQARWQAGMTRRVYQELTRSPGRFPDIEAIAETLCMTSRTLRRKLESEGTSYSELLASVRKALAIDYLSTTRLSTEDIASALGFSDAVGFRHAFKRGTGATPSEYRRDRAAAAAGRH